MNIAKISEERVRQQGEQVTLIFEGREITNLEMLRTGKRIGSALRSLGVNRGDRVILQMPNCPEVPPVLLCCLENWRGGCPHKPPYGRRGNGLYLRGFRRESGDQQPAFLPKIKVGHGRLVWKI